MSFNNVRMREYVTRAPHITRARFYPAGTPCLCARLPNNKAVLTFENESIILAEGWYLEGYEEPGDEDLLDRLNQISAVLYDS